MAVPEWLGKQLSDEAWAELREVKQPVALLYQLLDDEVPDYLYPLVMAARIIGNFAIYDDDALDEVRDKARALRIIKQAREELKDAERRCRAHKKPSGEA